MNKMEHCCPQMDQSINSDETSVVYVPKFREYGIRILDGGTSFQILIFCPWCGKKLPESLRDIWFDKLEHLGIDPSGNDIPPEYSDAHWWYKV